MDKLFETRKYPSINNLAKLALSQPSRSISEGMPPNATMVLSNLPLQDASRGRLWGADFSIILRFETLY